jgi:hypothetical protein
MEPDFRVTTRTIDVEIPEHSKELDEKSKILKYTGIKLLELGSHTLIMIVSLLSIWLGHLILKHLLNDETFFNLIKIRYLIDTADIAVVCRFIWDVIRGFKK